MLDKFFRIAGSENGNDFVTGQWCRDKVSMLDAKNINYQPAIAELISYINNPMIEKFLEHMQE